MVTLGLFPCVLSCISVTSVSQIFLDKHPEIWYYLVVFAICKVVCNMQQMF
jgi:hypothetical protein